MRLHGIGLDLSLFHQSSVGPDNLCHHCLSR
jgi:hypothetical protein